MKRILFPAMCPDVDLVFRRSYGSWSQRSGSLGIGWTHTYDWRVVTNAQSVYVYSAGERGVTDGTHVFSPPPPVGGSVVNKDGYELRHLGRGRLAVVTPERLTYSFDADGRLSSIQTWNGTGVTVVRDSASGSVVQARHSDGKSLGFVLDAKGRIVRVTTPDPGVWVEYFYASGGAGDRMRFETRAGEVDAEIVGSELVKIALPDPRDLRENFVNSGVPHAIVPVDDLAAADVAGEGRRIRFSEKFAPEGTNVDFVRYDPPNALSIRTYERGVEAETGACGTGSVAAALVGVAQHALSFPVRVKTALGYELVVDGAWDGRKFSSVTLTGSVQRVFDGVIDVSPAV